MKEVEMDKVECSVYLSLSANHSLPTSEQLTLVLNEA